MRGSGGVPLGIAVLRVHAHLTVAQWRSARGAIALRTAREGLALLDVVDVTGDAAADGASYEMVEGLAARTEVVAIITSDDVDLTRVEAIAERSNLLVLHMPLKVDGAVVDADVRAGTASAGPPSTPSTTDHGHRDER